VGVVSQSQLSMFGFSKVAAPPPDRRYATAALPTLSRGRDEERSEAIQFVVRSMGRASAIPIASLPAALMGFARAQPILRAASRPGLGSCAPVIPGRAEGASPESIVPPERQEKWIPGSMLTHRPGMTPLRHGRASSRPSTSLFPNYESKTWMPAKQFVGWVERQRYRFSARGVDGFRKRSTHPTGCIASGTRQLRTRHSGAR